MDALIDKSPDVMSGTPVFHGTRVPVQTLIDYLTSNETMAEFLDDFPTVSREQVMAFLETAAHTLVADVKENSA